MGQGNLRGQSQVEQRSRGPTCGQTGAATQGTPGERLRAAAKLVTLVLPRLSHGCPTPALVAAFGGEERPVAAGVTRAGQPCAPVHPQGVRPGQGDRQHVQAEARWGTRVGRRV